MTRQRSRTRKTAHSRRSARGASAPKRRAHAGTVGYAVVGLGYIAQAAVLPAFAHARRNSRLVALVSGDALKRRTLGRRYGVELAFDYDSFEECLARPEVDAVYVALPNFLHREFTVAAARAGKHVLCEKPLAVTVEDCEAMIAAARDNGVRLMTAYRLHFERANLSAIEIVRSGRLGEPRAFASFFSMQVDDDNVRLVPSERGGGPVYDLGIYCINAARYLFRAEPSEVVASSASIGDRRFARAPEMTSAILRFPVERLATFTCSFGAADLGWYEVVGTRGRLRLEPAYEYAEPLVQRVEVGRRCRTRRFAKRDQFAPELLYFSDCVLSGEEPEPSGREGLADVRVIRAILESARTGRPVALDEEFERHKRPSLALEARRPPVPGMPPLVGASSPSG